MPRSPSTAVSGTARNVAAFRALETEKSAQARLFADPYAERFLPLPQRLLARAARIPALARLLELYADARAPGARLSAIARTRLIDDWLRQELHAGASQVMILGAGFDCRALRLPELAHCTVFEIDRAAMVVFKAGILADVATANLRRVAVDFLLDDVADRLFAARYAKERKTTFIWEGVTNYLDEEAVAAVFDMVAKNAAPGSKILFTYVEADAIAGRHEAPGLIALLGELERRGEPWTFGFAPVNLRRYLAARGLTLVSDENAGAYRRRYWPDMPLRGMGYEFYHVAIAEKAGDAAH